MMLNLRDRYSFGTHGHKTRRSNKYLNGNRNIWSEIFGVSSERNRNHKYKGAVMQQNLCPSDSGRLDMASIVSGTLCVLIRDLGTQGNEVVMCSICSRST